jgi:hypothetical protein
MPRYRPSAHKFVRLVTYHFRRVVAFMIGCTFYQAKTHEVRECRVLVPLPRGGSYNKEGDIVASRSIANLRNNAQARLEESGRLAHDPGRDIDSSSSDEAIVAGLKVASGLSLSSNAVSYARVRFDFPEDPEAPANPLKSTRTKRRAIELSGMQLGEKAKSVLRNSTAKGIPFLLGGFHSHPFIRYRGLRVGRVEK